MSEDMRITAPFTEGELRHALEDEHGPATLMVRRLAHEVERLRGMYHDESITLRNELAAERARTDALRAGTADFRGLVTDLLTVWQAYAEGQFANAEGTKRLVLAERAQCMLDVKLALEHPQTIEWPDGHPRKVPCVSPEKPST